MGSPAAPLTLHCPKAEPEAGEAPAAKFGSAGGHSAAPTAAHQQRRASFAARHQSTAHGPVARYPNQLSSSTRFSQGQESLFKKPCCILGRTRPLGGCHDVEAVEVPTTAPHRSHSTPPPPAMHCHGCRTGPHSQNQSVVGAEERIRLVILLFFFLLFSFLHQWEQRISQRALLCQPHTSLPHRWNALHEGSMSAL